LCEVCAPSHLGKSARFSADHKSRPTFTQFKEEKLDPDQIKGLFWADDALLEYEYYKIDRKETGRAHFTPLLEGSSGLGDYKDEHVQLERWFIDQFFTSMQNRLRTVGIEKFDPGSLQGVREHFFDFRRSLNRIHQKISSHHYYGSLPDINPLKLLLKKLIVKNRQDPGAVDNIGKVFDPGSALYFLELYVALQDSDLLSRIQEDLINLPLSEAEHFIGSPRVIVLPWDHQQAAFDAWSRTGKKGIIEMATATGKTLVGLMAIEDMATSRELAKIRVVSNSRALLNQWKRESVQKLGLLQNVYKDFNIPVSWKGITVEFNTIQSVMNNPDGYPADLLIVDEVHHLAGPEFRKALQIQAPQKMGLSATVEGDLKLSILQEDLGPVVYQFGLKEALVKGIIPSFEWYVIPVYLAVEEAAEFASMSKAITREFGSLKYDYATIFQITGKRQPLEDLGQFIRIMERARYKKIDLPEKWKGVQALILKRRWIIHKSQPRLDHALALAKDLAKKQKVILFTMDTESCDYLGRELAKENNQTYVIHSNIKGDAYKLIEQYKHAQYGALIGAQMLSEGIDIPDAEIGINVAASKTRLQLTQRMGRILRKGTGTEKKPVFYHYVAIPEPDSYIPEEDDVAFLDDLAWVQDTALRMGLDAQVIWNEELLKEQGSQAENAFHNRFFSKDYAKIPKFGTFNLRYVTSQLSDQSIFRIIAILQNLTSLPELSDAAWAQIIRASCGKKKREHLDIPGYWWLLVLGKRDPSKIIEIFTKVRPSLEYLPDEKDERIVREVSGELNEMAVAVELETVAESAEILTKSQSEIMPVPLSPVSIPEIVIAEASTIQPTKITDFVPPAIDEEPINPEKVVSRFRVGNMIVTEIEFDHNIEDLLEESGSKEMERKDQCRLKIDDLFEPE